MSDTVILAIIGAVPATLMALGGVLISLRNGQKTDAVSVQADRLTTGQAQIHDLVNSNLTRIKNELAAAHAEIESLRTLVTTLRVSSTAVTP